MFGTLTDPTAPRIPEKRGGGKDQDGGERQPEAKRKKMDVAGIHEFLLSIFINF